MTKAEAAKLDLQMKKYIPDGRHFKGCSYSPGEPGESSACNCAAHEYFKLRSLVKT